MSRPTTSQPEQHGVAHQGQSPQVAVRDGNRLLCPCCGQTLMVLKEKRFTPPKRHHMQGDPRRTWPSLEKLIAKQEAYLNTKAEEILQEELTWHKRNTIRPFYRADELAVPIDEKIAAYEFPDCDPPKIDQPVKLPEVRAPEVTLRHQPPRDWNTQYDEHQGRRSKQPLRDPFTEEGARLFAWAYYRLQRLAVQIEKEIAAKQAEIARLKVELNGGQEEESQKPSTEKTMNKNEDSREKKIQMQRQDRPVRVHPRHAHADVSMTPQIVSEGSIVQPTEASKRGPP